MDVGDQQQAREDTNKTVTCCVLLVLCVCVPSAVCINRCLHDPTQNEGLAEASDFKLVPCNDDVLKCTADQAQSICLLNERMRTRSFPFVRLFYEVGSFLFLAVTLPLNLAQVSMLVWAITVLGNFASIFAIAGAR